MKRLTSLTAILMLSTVTGCNGAPNNALIGKWKLTTPADPACSTAYTFTATTQTMTSFGNTSTIPVTYNVTAAAVVLLPEGNIVNHVNYTILDKDTIRQETPMMCVYKRS